MSGSRSRLSGSGPRYPIRSWHAAPPRQTAALPDTLREVGEHALVAVRRWADPREREMRRRRRLRRRSVRLGTASGITTLGVVGLTVASAPAWVVVVLGGGAVALVTGAALSTRRYLRTRSVPLPPARYLPRKLPPPRSAARAPMERLARAERALHELGGRIAHSRRLPPDELDDMLATADSGAAALHALAADIAAMERAGTTLGAVDTETVGMFAEQLRHVLSRLETGVAEYEQIVAAAGRILAVPETTAVAHEFEVVVADLRHAADRMDGWAQALTELADQPSYAPTVPRSVPLSENSARYGWHGRA
ncbi:phage shock envelope stress response protein PspM [Nocardia paucivorans]|uniref:phage shock envelope stress response protein PspM n=1 Tax=Nocardia paucivorans TaxID=114259 RepID=UPI00031E64AC|nr:hypothetical protein [Nocardia paucivorans]